MAQVKTGLSPTEIQSRAMEREGDWGEQARQHPTTWNRPMDHPRPDYGDRIALDEGAWEPENIGLCPATSLPFDLVLDELYSLGLDATDVANLERLSDPRVRRHLGTNTIRFAHHRRENVIAYMKGWAELLEAELLEAELVPDSQEEMMEPLHLAAE
ncbi:MAG: hypothetical protein MK135_16790 [Polyangiaceae bacterium]|nr:hypothetical protein [Polyangiaceae bacterium]